MLESLNTFGYAWHLIELKKAIDASERKRNIFKNELHLNNGVFYSFTEQATVVTGAHSNLEPKVSKSVVRFVEV